MTAILSDAHARLVRVADGMHLTARRLRHELDRMLADCRADDLRNVESRRASQILVTTSALLMVLQADILEALIARAEYGKCMLAEARTVMAALSVLTDGQEGEHRSSATPGAGEPPTPG